MKKFGIVILLLFLSSCSKMNNNEYKITSDNLIKTVSFLASPELKGRLSGSKEFYKAANFIADEFNRLGLEKFQNDSYFQKFNVEYNEINQPIELSKYRNGKVEKTYELGKDFVFRGFTGNGNVTADVIFAGYGFSIPEYDDYKNIDVKNKIVMVFKYNPKWKLDGVGWPSSLPREKARTAFEHGAKAIFYISFPNDKNPQKTIGSVMHGKGEQVNIPQVHIDLPVAADFFENSKYNLKDVQSKIDSEKKSFSFDLRTKAKVKVSTKYVKEKETVNIIGIYRGTDTKLKDEFVILGAHLDHVGEQGGKIFFPGANDNASGSAAVLEVARAFAENKIKTKRSIMFVLFASEESGLEGAFHLADNLPIDTSKVTAMLNMDCVGHGDSIKIGSGKTSPKLWELAKKLDAENIKLSVKSTWANGGADATPFHNKGIPTLYFVTTNSYTHLHCLTDTPETLNPELFEAITKLAFLTTKEIAQGNYQREELVK